MGSYLSTPIKEKHSEDTQNDKLACGTSCMQGWRLSQEDAHNSILNFDDGISLFAVYDGHGGSEVAEYCSLHLPDYIKQVEDYTAKNYKEALIKSFLGFDATLTDSKVRDQLKSLLNSDEEPHLDIDDKDAEINYKKSILDTVQQLRNESELPLNEVMQNIYKGMAKRAEESKTFALDFSMKDIDDEPSTSGCNVNRRSSRNVRKTFDRKDEGSSQCHDDDSLIAAEGNTSECSASTPIMNGTSNSSVNSELNETDSIPSVGNDSTAIVQSNSKDFQSPSKKGKGVVGPAILSPTKTADMSEESQIDDEKVYKTFKLNNFSDESDSDDETFEISADKLEDSDIDDEDTDSEDDEDEDDDDEDEAESDENDLSLTLDKCDDGNDTETSTEITETEDTKAQDKDDCDDDEEENDSSDDDDIEEDVLEDIFISGGCMPGYNSGCTAVVALVTENCVYVANAGDSRCVASKAGVAVDLSIDHKPEDKIERMRIKRAGGSVKEGRINNGLNLSRAIGDHYYKRNKSLSSTEQMITAKPDIKVCKITPDLEFIVLACDGIWNSMTSEEVVNFVRTKLSKNTQLSKICEELFDLCLAPNTLGDGTGCDNMTCIIVKFQSGSNVTGEKKEDEKNDNEKLKEPELAFHGKITGKKTHHSDDQTYDNDDDKEESRLSKRQKTDLGDDHRCEITINTTKAIDSANGSSAIDNEESSSTDREVVN